MEKERYIGMMSGTSLDGVDVVLCEIDAHVCKLLSSFEYPMPLALKTDLLEMIADKTSLEKVGEVDQRLGVIFAEAVNAFLSRDNIDIKSIRAVGLHGQTLWHNPSKNITMQLGDANTVAVQTGIPVVSDFRKKDVALGGQGAPFAPAFHEFIFGNINSSLSVVNIGGMANITVLPSDEEDELIGYDTGCGNVLLDFWVNKHYKIAYDKEGVWARSGELNRALLNVMMEDPYFLKTYPKSTGREKFNEAWLEQMLSTFSFGTPRPMDVQRTLLEFTALSITNEIKRFKVEVVLLCGGGAKNTFLVERIKALLLGLEVHIAENADALEAMAFAWLAYKRIHKEKVNLKNVTGASDNAILGGLYA